MNSLNKVLIVDVETTGLRNETIPSQLYVDGPQIIQLGALVVDIKNDWEPIETFSTGVRFEGSHNGVSYGTGNYSNLTWDANAETIHGISIIDNLKEPPYWEAASNFVSFVRKHFTKNGQCRVTIGGHNPTGDRYHILQLLYLAGLISEIKINHRMLDSFTLGFMLWGCENSDDLFKRVSSIVRNNHTALEDAELCHQVFHEAYCDINMNK